MKRLYTLLTLLAAGCGSDDPNVIPPIITITEPTDITLTSATFGVTIESTQPELITDRGVCWAQNTLPELGNLSSQTSNGSGAGAFTTELTGLGLNKYYVRAYAGVQGQVFYGNEVTLDIGALVPTITTVKKANVGTDAVEVQTTVAYTHSLPITEKGICWATTAVPSITVGTKLVDEGPDLTFNQVITLAAWKSYYVRGYVITELGVYYSGSIQIVNIPPVTYGEVTDIDGNVYPTTTIGTTVWMAKNLQVTRFNDGTNISAAKSESEFMTASTSMFVPYNVSPGNLNTYGYLYNGYTVTSDKNVCMTGWHLPTVSEWNSLANNLGGNKTAGGRMKAVSNLWENPNTAADNESGFSALPGGSYCRICLGNSGVFADQRTDGYWWSAANATFFYATNDLASLRTKSTGNVNDGLSIRCVKD
jgi:uncharacterized protein (TIGR02145 family)